MPLVFRFQPLRLLPPTPDISTGTLSALVLPRNQPLETDWPRDFPQVFTLPFRQVLFLKLEPEWVGPKVMDLCDLCDCLWPLHHRLIFKFTGEA